ncbi:MAG: hypothetical protein ACHQK8_09595 [Bacteroidia bacterium]
MKFIKGNNIFNLILLAPILLVACKGNEIYSFTPEIKNVNEYVMDNSAGTRDSIVMLSFDYTDGDGDIGLDVSVTAPPFNSDTLGPNHSNSNRYANNVWVDYYQKINGEYIPPIFPTTTDTIRRDVRTGDLTPEGTHKAIRGTISLPVLTLSPSWPGRSDTVQIRVRLLDRALHISNELRTPDIILHP